MRRALAPLLVPGVAVFSLITFFFYSSYNFNTNTKHRLSPTSKLSKEGIIDIGILKDFGIQFLPNFKNPCWYESRGSQGDDDDDDEMNTNFYASSFKPFTWPRHKSRQRSTKILRCLPYFFLIGQPKCATTDVFQRINIHPDVAEPMIKGPHWWTRRRFGPPYAPRPVTFTEYLDIFNTLEIEDTQGSFHEKITGDGSTSTLWDSGSTMSYIHTLVQANGHQDVISKLLSRRRVSDGRTKLPQLASDKDNLSFNADDLQLQGNEHHDYYGVENGTVLPFTVADVIHSVLPRARIIAVFRDPVSRLFSSYLFFTKRAELSPENFHQCVESSIEQWRECTIHYSDRICAYNKTLQKNLGVRLYNGLYSVFLRDWLKVFDLQQLFVIRMEDYHQNISKTIASVYQHLDLRTLTQEELKRVNTAPVRNKNWKKPEIGAMLESTAKILQAFYEPYNRDLANILQDSRFTWQDIYEKS